jgi:hypothetical protein
VPWWLFAATLVILGASFLSLALRPFLGSSGWLPGIAHLLQAGFVVLALCGGPDLATFSAVPALFKYTALATFAVREKRDIGRRTRNLLVALSLAELAKILMRTLIDLPTIAALALDALLLLILIATLWRLARSVAYQEDVWASRRLAELTGRFEDFNRVVKRIAD